LFFHVACTRPQRLVRDPKLLRKLATNARNAYEQYFGLERFGKGFLALFEEAIVIGNPRVKNDADLMTHAPTR
jgi:hypothetical protein